MVEVVLFFISNAFALLALFVVPAIGPATVLYGLAALFRGRVRFTRQRVLYGDQAFVAGLVMMLVGCAMIGFLWYMLRYLPH